MSGFDNTATPETIKHYQDPVVKETILRCSQVGNGQYPWYRWGNGDFWRWYWYSDLDGGKYPYCLGIDRHYESLIRHYRTLYWTLNIFEYDQFVEDYKQINNEKSPRISREYTMGYSFGIDIDKEHGQDIHDPEIKQAVEDMGQYFVDTFKQYAPNSVYVLFSGGGIYVMLHHRATQSYFERFSNREEKEYWMEILLKAVSNFIDETRKDFFEQYPQHKGKAKPDNINNSKRVFKTVFSIHRKHDYAVIPLNPDNVKIDFEEATIPLNQEVIDRGKNWYVDYDTDDRFLRNLKPWLEEAKQQTDDEKYLQHQLGFSNGTGYASEPIEDIQQYPPCVRNLLNLKSCGEGKTRALAFIASFLGQMNMEEEKAKRIFYGLADRWDAATTNIFESYFMKMKTPSCKRINEDDNRGFPQGVSLKHLGVCQPDRHCFDVSSPRYYADAEANKQRVINKLKL